MRPPARPVVARQVAARPVVARPTAPGLPARPTLTPPDRVVGAARFTERAGVRRRLRRRRVLLGLGGLVALAAAGGALFASPLLALRTTEVVIVGAGTVVDPGAVMALVDPHAGTPLPRLDTVGLRRQILVVPGVREAQVARVWPHGLRITLVSREPVAAVPDGTEFALLDSEGVAVGTAEQPPAGLPVVSVPLEAPRALTAVLTVLRQLPADLAAEVVTASADSQDTVRLELSDGALVEWGSADQTALKIRVLQTLRAAEASRGAAVYDVSAPTMPITRS